MEAMAKAPEGTRPWDHADQSEDRKAMDAMREGKCNRLYRTAGGAWIATRYVAGKKIQYDAQSSDPAKAVLLVVTKNGA